jgi:hypothetical protein
VKQRLALYAALLIGTMTILAGASRTPEVAAQPPAGPTLQQQYEENQKQIQELQQQLAALKVAAQQAGAQPPAAQPLPQPPAKGGVNEKTGQPFPRGVVKPPAPVAPAPMGPPKKMPKAAKGGINLKTGLQFGRGLTPTPRAVLLAAPKFKPTIAAPTQYAVVPSKLDMWGNDVHGDCVTAEEAYKCACSGVFISSAEVVRWARANGVLEGADLQPVIRQMQSKGFSQDGNFYNDGKESTVDYTNESTLRAAIAVGVVKLGLDANALPQGAGNQQGWYDFGGTPGEFDNEDHSTALSGCGTAKFCFDSLHLPLPAGVDPNKPDCYIFFTWSTCGVVDFPWIQSCVGEAWVRNPGTIIVGTGTPTPDPPLDPVPPVTVAVPNLTGAMFADAKALCAAVGLSCNLAAGSDPTQPIASQTPAPGSQVASGAAVTVMTGVVPIPPDPSGDIVVTIKSGSPPGPYIAISDANAAALRAKLAEIDAILNSGATPDRPPPIRPPDGWEDDAAIMSQLGKAMAKQGMDAAKFKALGDKGGHPVVARLVYHKMRTDPAGAKIIRDYKPGALPVGWLQNLLDWFIKNGPALLNLVMEIMKLFGLGMSHAVQTGLCYAPPALDSPAMECPYPLCA